MASGDAAWSNVYWGTNGFDIYTSSVSGLNIDLGAGDYWLELSNGAVADGSNIFWDENDGTSLAYQNATGSINSQAFTVYGPGGSPVPEPSSFLLLGSGLAGLAGLLKRKFRA